MTMEKRLAALLTATPAVLQQVDAVLNGKALIGQTPAIPKVYSRDEAGQILGISPKRIDQLTTAGALKKVFAPNTARAIGVSYESLYALATGRHQGIEAANV